MLSSRNPKRGRAKTPTAHPNLPLRQPRDAPQGRFRVPPSLAGPKRVFVSCHYCGYDPACVPADALCPKCGGHSWERFTVSTRLLPEED